MSSSRVFQLIYRSTFQRGRIDSPLAALREIVKQSQAGNAALGVTGFLVFDGITFLQVLEGKEDHVLQTYARIARDARHRDVTLLATRIIGKRDFAEWNMEGHLGRPRDRESLMKHGATNDELATVPSSAIVALIKEIAGLASQLPEGV